MYFQNHQNFLIVLPLSEYKNLKTYIKNEYESFLSLIEKEKQLKGIETIRKFNSFKLPIYTDTGGIRKFILILSITQNVLLELMKFSPFLQKF
jgi:hypothetical protein